MGGQALNYLEIHPSIYICVAQFNSIEQSISGPHLSSAGLLKLLRDHQQSLKMEIAWNFPPPPIWQPDQPRA